ncbi:MAG: hypothetical protein ACLP4R_30600 [Solirubrobacteraceae bacterium]
MFDRIGVATLDHAVEKLLDCLGGEVADIHREPADPVVLAPLPVVGIVIPDDLVRRSDPFQRSSPLGVARRM